MVSVFFIENLDMQSGIHDIINESEPVQEGNWLKSVEEDELNEIKNKDHSRILYDYTCAADFIFSQFIWIEPYEIRTSDTEFFRCGI